VPKVNVKEARTLYNALHRAIEAGCVASCHDCSDGGLGVALAECAFAGGLGMMINLKRVQAAGIDRDDTLLFSESQSRFVVTVAPENREKFEEILGSCTAAQVGTVLAEELLIINGLKGNRVVEEDINELKAAWQKPLNF